MAAADQIERFAVVVKSLDYAPLTARYESLLPPVAAAA